MSCISWVSKCPWSLGPFWRQNFIVKLIFLAIENQPQPQPLSDWRGEWLLLLFRFRRGFGNEDFILFVIIQFIISLQNYLLPSPIGEGLGVRLVLIVTCLYLNCFVLQRLLGELGLNTLAFILPATYIEEVLVVALSLAFLGLVLLTEVTAARLVA